MKYEVTKEMVLRGIESGAVWFSESPNGESDPVCHIGDNWFFFAGLKGEEGMEHLNNVPIEDIASEVAEAIEGIKDDIDEDEALYYYLTLQEVT